MGRTSIPPTQASSPAAGVGRRGRRKPALEDNCQAEDVGARLRGPNHQSRLQTAKSQPERGRRLKRLLHLAIGRPNTMPYHRDEVAPGAVPCHRGEVAPGADTRSSGARGSTQEPGHSQGT